MGATSNRALARQLGVSETAVRRAEKAGRIEREPDGGWDLARVKAAWAGNTDTAQQRPKPGAGERSGRPARMKPVPEAALGAVRDTLREHGEPIAAGPGHAMTFMQARTANEVLKAQERRVRVQRMKGALVDRAKAQVFKLAREGRDAWANWPARVAAMIAADLEVDAHELHTTLERCVRDHLTELVAIRPRTGGFSLRSLDPSNQVACSHIAAPRHQPRVYSTNRLGITIVPAQLLLVLHGVTVDSLGVPLEIDLVEDRASQVRVLVRKHPGRSADGIFLGCLPSHHQDRRVGEPRQYLHVLDSEHGGRVEDDKVEAGT
jgi:hypothetical protein